MDSAPQGNDVLNPGYPTPEHAVAAEAVVRFFTETYATPQN